MDGCSFAAFLSLSTLVFTGCAAEDREFGEVDDTSTEPSETDSTSSSPVTDSTGTDGTDGLADCRGCVIAGECLTAGSRNPDNECQVCTPSESQTDWSADNDRECDDGLFCTENDTCSDGQCVGAARECDDGVQCNGTSECDEETDSCSEPESTCGDQLCDLQLDECVTTCNGCSIAGQCVPEGTANPSNECLVCVPDASKDDYSVASGWACGSETDTPCNAPDLCDDNDVCMPNESADGESCDDGLYCTAASACQSGECVETEALACAGAAEERCDEATQSCVCDGCVIDGTCYQPWSNDPTRECFACIPEVSTDTFSPNEGAYCGAEASECSQQDLCDITGTCLPNHEADGKDCSAGECQTGECVTLKNPFDCIAPTPPESVLPMDVFGASGAVPTAQGGEILDGRYVPVRIDVYSDTVTNVGVRTFEFSNSFFQAAFRDYSITTGGAFIPQVEFAGTFATNGDQLTFTEERCDPQYELDLPLLWYTVSANGLTLFEAVSDGAIVTSYVRE